MWQYRPITTGTISTSAATLLRGQYLEAAGHSSLSLAPFFFHSIDVIYGKEHYREAKEELMNSTVTIQFTSNHVEFLNLRYRSVLILYTPKFK